MDKNRIKYRLLCSSSDGLRIDRKGNANFKFSYVGKNAKNADISELERAVKMEQQGIDADTIRKETGWFLGFDNQWRFEISDADTTIKKPFSTKGALFGDVFKQKVAGGQIGLKIKDILNAPNLFAAYPELEEIPITDTQSSSYYNTKEKLISINRDTPMFDVKSTLLHELQHAIQDIEGFASGGSPTGVMTLMSYLREVRNTLLPEAKNQLKSAESAYRESYDEADEKKVKSLRRTVEILQDTLDNPQNHESDYLDYGRRTYRRLAGEIESRDTDSRMKLTDAQRRESAPYISQGISKEDAIVRFSSDVSNRELYPTNTHTTQSFLYSARSKLNTKFGKGWFDKLWKTGNFVTLSNSEAEKLVGANSKFHKAWHGSPHDFDKFNIDNIGTSGGIGFGYGLYFANDRAVAEWYRNNLDPSKKGKLFEVNLSPSQDEYLLLDEPLCEQSDFVKKALLKSGNKTIINAITTRPILSEDGEYWNYMGDTYESKRDALRDYTGLKIILGYIKVANGEKETSEFLYSLGIKGNKYRSITPVRKYDDGVSSYEDEDEYNYVIFNDKDITIEAKYSKDGKIEAFYNSTDNKVYFIPENISQDVDLVYLFLHEIGVHMRQMGENKKGFQAILNEVEDLVLRKNPHALEGRKHAVEAETREEDLNEETLAYMLKHAPKLNVVQKFGAWYRNGLRRWGLTHFKGEDKKFWLSWESSLTINDISYMATSSLKQTPTKIESEKVHLAPNGKPSNLTSEQWKQVRTSKFKQWFGDWENDHDNSSVVVDENGEPLVVYTAFKTAGTFEKSEMLKVGAFFTPSRKIAMTYFGDTIPKSIVPVFLNIRNPKVLRKPLPSASKVPMSKSLQKKIQIAEDKGYGGGVYGAKENLRQMVLKLNTDGVLLEKTYYPSDKPRADQWVVFFPNQVKSAVKNRGSFNPKSDSIYANVLPLKCDRIICRIIAVLSGH